MCHSPAAIIKHLSLNSKRQAKCMLTSWEPWAIDWATGCLQGFGWGDN